MQVSKHKKDEVQHLDRSSGEIVETNPTSEIDGKNPHSGGQPFENKRLMSGAKLLAKRPRSGIKSQSLLSVQERGDAPVATVVVETATASMLHLEMTEEGAAMVRKTLPDPVNLSPEEQKQALEQISSAEREVMNWAAESLVEDKSSEIFTAAPGKPRKRSGLTRRLKGVAEVRVQGDEVHIEVEIGDYSIRNKRFTKLETVEVIVRGNGLYALSDRIGAKEYGEDFGRAIEDFGKELDDLGF